MSYSDKVDAAIFQISYQNFLLHYVNALPLIEDPNHTLCTQACGLTFLQIQMLRPAYRARSLNAV